MCYEKKSESILVIHIIRKSELFLIWLILRVDSTGSRYLELILEIKEPAFFGISSFFWELGTWFQKWNPTALVPIRIALRDSIISFFYPYICSVKHSACDPKKRLQIALSKRWSIWKCVIWMPAIFSYGPKQLVMNHRIRWSATSDHLPLN